MKNLLTFLASLKLAVILLVLLLIGLSVGTIIESRSGVAAAGALVYYSWWFLGLQGLFAINVALCLSAGLPAGFETLIQPAKALLLSQDEAGALRDKAVEEWQAALAQ